MPGVFNWENTVSSVWVYFLWFTCLPWHTRKLTCPSTVTERDIGAHHSFLIKFIHLLAGYWVTWRFLKCLKILKSLRPHKNFIHFLTFFMVIYPAIRMGSSNTDFFLFFVGHLSQTPGSCLVKQTLITNFWLNIYIIFSGLTLIYTNFRESRCTKLPGMQWHQKPFEQEQGWIYTSKHWKYRFCGLLDLSFHSEMQASFGSFGLLCQNLSGNQCRKVQGIQWS